MARAALNGADDTEWHGRHGWHGLHGRSGRHCTARAPLSLVHRRELPLLIPKRAFPGPLRPNLLHRGLMAPRPTLHELRGALRHHRALRVAGISDRQLQAMKCRDEVTAILHGWYVRSDFWSSLYPSERHLQRVLAIDAGLRARPASQTDGPVFGYASAAALLGLPLHGISLERAHLLVPARNLAHSSPRVQRRVGPCEAEQLVTTAGIVHTGVRRTVVDIARSEAFESGLLCAEEGLRRLVREEALSEAEGREQLLATLWALPKSRGSRRAERILRRATALSESPLESLTKLQLERLGFRVRQQVRVPGRHGEELRIDIELVGYDTFVETDGLVKYRDEQLRGGRSAEDVLIEEKLREDWVRGTTRCSLVRVVWRDVRTTEALAQKLRAFGIEPPRSPHSPPDLDLY